MGLTGFDYKEGVLPLVPRSTVEHFGPQYVASTLLNAQFVFAILLSFLPERASSAIAKAIAQRPVKFF